MNGVPNAVGVMFLRDGGSGLPATGSIGGCGLDVPLGCVCRSDKIAAVHAYVKQHFPDRSLHNLHAPTTLMREGVLAERGDYHVVSMAAELPSHAILLKEFLEHSAARIEEHLWQWDLACALRAHRIVIVGGERVSWL
jgi:hypothetical protein